MQVLAKLLGESEGVPAIFENEEGRGPIVFICEHASHHIPVSLGALGLSEDVLVSHVAWDPGALQVSRILAAHFDAPLVFQRYSRLVYDCNRPPESSAAMPERSEVYLIPGNENLTDEEKRARVKEIYQPFHAAVGSLIKDRIAKGLPSAIVTVHTFTPVYFGQKRDVEIGILHDTDTRMADRMLAVAAGAGTFNVRRNEPYGPSDGVTHTLRLHGLSNGLENVMIEIRNDLVADENGQEVAADYIAGLLSRAITRLDEENTHT